MMKTFNSTFETVLRILCLLAHSEREINAERIMLIDFIATYGKNYKVAKSNLHGDVTTNVAELAARRVRIQRALRQMVRDGYIILKSDDGFRYIISEQGCKYACQLHSDYAETYSNAVKSAFRLYDSYSDAELMALVCEKYEGGSL